MCSRHSLCLSLWFADTFFRFSHWNCTVWTKLNLSLNWSKYLYVYYVFFFLSIYNNKSFMNSFEKLCANYFVRSLSCANTNTWLKENKRIGNHLRVYQSGSMCTCECLFFFPLTVCISMCSLAIAWIAWCTYILNEIAKLQPQCVLIASLKKIS